MLNKRHNSVVTLAILLTLVGVSKPAKADLVAQAGATSATFTVPDKLPKDSTVKIGASNSTSSIGTSLQEGFLNKYPQARVNIEIKDSSAALKSLAEGKVDLAAIGRALTADEKAQGFVSVPISREKIAIIVSKNNPFEGNLTIDQFAKIFRGEITDWSEIGGTPGKIQLVDSPNSNDTRQSLPNYAVFQSADFKTGSTASQLKEDNVDAMVAKLGANGISYAVANDVMNRDDVKVVTMHSTLPDDPRYPFSEPFSLIYQGTPSKAAQAYLGYATTEGGQKVVASRVGSVLTAGVAATASGVGVNLTNPDNPKSTTTAPVTGATATGDVVKKGTDALSNGKDAVSANAKKGADALSNGKDAVSANAKKGADALSNGKDAVSPTAKKGADAIANGKDIKAVGDADKTTAGVTGTDKNAIANADSDSKVNADVKGSGAINPDVNGSGEINPDLKGSGEVNPDVNGSGEVNPDVKGSGEVNPDVNGSGEVNPDVQGSGEPLSSKNGDVDGVNTKETTVAPAETADADSGAKVAAKKGQWWWWLLPLLGIPLLAAAIFGGRGKSDQEPALDDIPNINSLDNGSGMPRGSGGGDIPPVGVNTSGGLGNVVENTTNAASNLGTAGLAAGGAALAGGAAAAANLAGRRNRTENVADADMDLDLDLDLDEPATVEEIPSNPVTEFTGQATKLQFDDQSEDLEGDGNFDLDDVNASIADDVALGGAAGIGGVAAASEFAQDAENRTEINFDTESLDVEDVGLDTNVGQNVAQFTTEQATDLAQSNTETDFVEVVETDGVNGDGTVAREFTGDFVLEEESKVDLSTDVDLDPNAEGTGIIDGVTQAGGAAIAGGAAAAATGFFNREENTTEDTGIDARIEVPDSEQNTDLNTNSNIVEQVGEGINNVSTNITENVSNLTGNITAPDLDPNLDINLDPNRDPNAEGTGIIDSVTQAGGAAIAGGAAALGGAAAAATGFFNREENTTEDTGIDARIEVPDSEQNTDLNIVEQVDEGINNVSTNITENVSNLTGNITAPDLDPNLDINLDPNRDPNAEGTGIIDSVTQAGGAAIAGGAAALGGAAAAATGFFNREENTREDTGIDARIEVPDSEQNIDVNTDSNTDANLVEQVGEGINNVSTNITENVSNLTGNITTPDLDPNLDINLDPNGDPNAEGTGIIDSVTQAGGAAIAGGAAALGGAAAAATGFFNRDSQETADIQEFETFETSLDATGDSTSPTSFADNVIADAETISPSLDNEDETINASLEEITFDDATPTGEISLDDFTFEDTDSTINASLEEITLEDATTTAAEQDINLDDLGFEEISNLSDEQSGDLNNISEWLDSLETPNQDRDNIADWLDTLDKDSIRSNPDAVGENINQETDDLAENDDISFQFLEDLLDRDAQNNPKNQ